MRSSAVPDPISLDELVRRTAEGTAARRRGAVVAGAVLGTEFACRGAGSTGAADGHSPGPDTVFEIGSVTKTLTSLALARLSVAETVQLVQPLRDLLPDGARIPAKNGRQIRLIELSTHTSGLPRLPKGMLPRAFFPMRDPYAAYTPDRLLAGLAGTRLRHEPGRTFRYSNLGAGMLGLALAHHTGRDYDTLIREEVCAPLGLADTGVALSGEQTARLARGHNRRGTPTGRWTLAGLAGAGGLHSTGADLLALLRAQLAGAAGHDGSGPDRPGPGGPSGAGPDAGSGPTPGKELTEAIRRTHEGGHWVNQHTQIHLGWVGIRSTRRAGGHRLLFHNGATGGYRSFIAIAPEHRAGVVVLSAQQRSVDRTGLELLNALVRRARAA
jgi:CubicO group peptidase (beta-lactamase class C family)